MNSNIKNPNAGLADKHHHDEHLSWSRRTFLRNIGIAGGTSLLMGSLPITTFSRSPLSMGLSNSDNDNILVMVRLQGGNDGLNTVIPLYDYSRYQSLRPLIAIPENQAISLTSELGLHPGMQSAKFMWNIGAMKVINNIGYPNQNLSHFRSSDIWTTASDSNVVWDKGWLGRFYDDKYPDFLLNPPTIPPAIQIGGAGDLVFTGDNSTNYAISVPTPELLEYIASSGGLYDASDVPECLYGDQLAFIRTITNNTFKYAQSISTAYKNGENDVEYYGDLGRQLSVIAKLIKGNLGTKLYVVTLNGFDTHASQLNQHHHLLELLSLNMKAFYEDLQLVNYDRKVLAFTFSEFGRRPQQNASQGTDHGAAAPTLIFGPSLEGSGSLGGLPNLNDLDMDDNLKHQIDFRSLYATLLEKWLCVDPVTVDLVLGNNFDRLNLGFSCMSVSQSTVRHPSSFKHEGRYDGSNVFIYGNLPRRGEIKVELFNAMGQSYGIIFNGFSESGDKLFPVQDYKVRVPGYYFYQMKYEGRIYSGKVLIK